MDRNIHTFTISPTSTVAEFQAAFREKYPLLKIEFFTKSHQAFTSSFSKFKVFDTNKRLCDLGTIPTETEIYFEPSMSVVDFENQLSEKYQLHTQIYRRGNGVWIETIESDIWTLEEQSRVAEESQKDSEKSEFAHLKNIQNHN